MATSSAFATSNDYIKYRITVTENSQSVSGNYSTVTVSVRFYRTNTGYTTSGNGSLYCTIDGTTYKTTVTNSQKITESGIVLFTKTLQIAHDADGTKNLTCSAYIEHSRFTSSSNRYTETLTRIGRHSRIVSSDVGVLGTAQGLVIEQYSSDYTHTITYECGDASGIICEKSSETTINFEPPLELAAQNTTGSAVFIILTIETFNGEESIGAYSMNLACGFPTNVRPSCEIVVSDVYGYEDRFDAFIKGKSAFIITVHPTISYGAEIVSYGIEANGATYTTQTAVTDLIKTSGELTITATVVDQRGRKGTSTITVDVLEHSAPTISSFRMVRCNAFGDASSSGAYAKAIFSNEVTTLNNKNTAVYTLQYKKTSETSYTSVTMTGYANTYSNTDAEFIVAAGFDAGATFDVILTIEDAFSSTSRATMCASAYKLWSMLRKGLGFAFGKVAELENVFEVAFKTKLTGGLLHPVPKAETNLDTLTAPNIYKLSADGAYINAPEDDVEAILYVDGDESTIRQRVFAFDGVSPSPYEKYTREYERIYANGTWGEWVDLNRWMKHQIALTMSEERLNYVYPIGTVHLESNGLDPGDLFGGTWEQITSGISGVYAWKRTE